METILPKLTRTLPIEFQEQLNEYLPGSDEEDNEDSYEESEEELPYKHAKLQVLASSSDQGVKIDKANQLAKHIGDISAVIPRVQNYKPGNDAHNRKQPLDSIQFEFNSSESRNQFSRLINPNYIVYNGTALVSGKPILQIIPEFLLTLVVDDFIVQYKKLQQQQLAQQSIVSVPATMFAAKKANTKSTGLLAARNEDLSVLLKRIAKSLEEECPEVATHIISTAEENGYDESELIVDDLMEDDVDNTLLFLIHEEQNVDYPAVKKHMKL
ncbi:hypothetical protein [Legionella tunisiensis]|uniref:hypothetical protein n=1 Tax=Legionella tunisiensis TaxID=1034944 RepID=UPI00059483F6|nr:hypothetical protein [Legionella tunisiensis]